MQQLKTQLQEEEGKVRHEFFQEKDRQMEAIQVRIDHGHWFLGYAKYETYFAVIV